MFNNILNLKIYIFDYIFEQYNLNIFVKIVDNIYFNTNNILLTKLKFVNNYKYKLLLIFLNIIEYIFNLIEINIKNIVNLLIKFRVSI